MICMEMYIKAIILCYIYLHLIPVYIALVFVAWGIYDVQYSITHAEPDQGAWAQVYVITCFKVQLFIA